MSHRGFTLVELIVVITILAILWSIGFLSLKWWSADSRDSKRTSDVNNIYQAIDLAMIAGRGVRTFVDGTGSTITSTATGTNVQLRISWVEGFGALSGSYVGWDVAYDSLSLDKDNFLDPKVSVPYKIWATDYGKSFFEVSATIENGGDVDTLVKGTWSPRIGSISYTGSQNGNTFTLSGITYSDTNLRLLDTVRFNSGTTDNDKYQIVQMNGNTIVLDRTITSPGSTIFLHKDETRHLIKRWKSNSAIDTWTGSDYTPYLIN